MYIYIYIHTYIHTYIETIAALSFRSSAAAELSSRDSARHVEDACVKLP